MNEEKPIEKKLKLHEYYSTIQNLNSNPKINGKDL